jgi:hypothetical protein
VIVDLQTQYRAAVRRQLEGQRRASRPVSFDAASKTVREEDVTAQMLCRPDVQRHIAGIRPFEEAGDSHIALAQVGGDTQEQFITRAATELLPALRLA